MSSANLSTLSKRGVELANIPSLRDKWTPILKNPYDPDKNPDGFIALGISENVGGCVLLESANQVPSAQFPGMIWLT